MIPSVFKLSNPLVLKGDTQTAPNSKSDRIYKESKSEKKNLLPQKKKSEKKAK